MFSKNIDQIRNQFEFFVFNKELNVFQNLKETESGKIQTKKIFDNFLKRRDTMKLFNTSKHWAHSFKLSNNDHVLKIIDEELKVPNKVPGIVINQIAKKENILKIISKFFPEEHTNYLNVIKQNKKQKILESKTYLCLLLEVLFREKNSKNMLSYDSHLLKFISE
jgi:hypothetical protein